MSDRVIPGVLFTGDRETIELWRNHGLPVGLDSRYDNSTVEACVRLCVRLLDGLDVAWDVIDSFTAGITA